MHGPDANRPRYPRGTLLGRIATYVVPTLAVAITAAVLFGPGATRKAAFVRVYGTPVPGATTLSLRIEGAQRLYGIDEKASFQNIVVESTDGATALDPVRLSLGPDGIGEALITSSRPFVGPFELRVRRDKHVLAQGALSLDPQVTFELVRLAPLRLPGQTSGNIKLYVTSRRSSLAAPFADVLDVQVGLAEHVSPSNRGFDRIALEASAPGATIQPEKFVTDEHGSASIVVTPLAHHVELTITAQDPAHGDGKWVGTLPVIPGAIWMNPETKNSLEFVSPAPRDRLYVSVMDNVMRIFGAVVSVSPDEQQQYRGRLELPESVQKKATYVVVAGDPQEQGTGTVAWPLRSGIVDLSAVRFGNVLDGARAGEEYERGRASRVRRLALLVVIATTIFEVLFMLVRSRQSQKRFEENLMEFAEGEGPTGQRGDPLPMEKRVEALASSRQENPVLRVALAVSLVLVAFSMIGALSTLQW